MSGLRAFRQAPVAAPLVGRLIGHAGMIGAIGQFVDGFAAAKEELGAAGVADRPMTRPIVELEQCLALRDRDFDQVRLEIRLVVVGERGIAAHRMARHPQHVAAGTRLARPRRRRGRAFGATGQAETVHLPDHRIARNAAEFRRDLACRQALGPQFLQQFHPLVGPVHQDFSPAFKALEESARTVGARGAPDPYASGMTRNRDAARYLVSCWTNATIYSGRRASAGKPPKPSYQQFSVRIGAYGKFESALAPSARR